MRFTTAAVLLLVTLAFGACAETPQDDSRPQWPQSPKDAAGYNLQLGMAYLQKGNLALAREKIERALAQDSTNPDVHRAAALLYDRLGEPNRADRHYAAVLRLKPRDPEALNNYGVFLCRRGKTDEGERLILQAARDPVFRTPETAFTNAGLCLRGAKRYEEATRHFQRAVALEPKHRDALLQLAEMNFEQGRLPDAQLYVQRYIEGTGESPEILWLGVRVERALGNRRLAEAYAKRLKSEYPTTEQTRALLASERKPG